MNSRERIRTIIGGEAADRCGLWIGEPQAETLQRYFPYFGVKTEEALRRHLKDDFRWICPQWDQRIYTDNKLPFFVKKKGHAEKGPFADCEDANEIADWDDWCSVDAIDFTPFLERLEATPDVYIASGMWTCFYHNVMDLFGMEDYLVKMYEEPEVVHAVTDKVCEYYYAANERFFELAGDKVDAFFFGNDFGTQLDLICGPAQFDEFIMPWFRKFTDLGHRFGKQVILHSCGSIHKVIDRLIEAKVDCLHPLQAKAVKMEAETLASDFGGKITFMGGIDTQDLLVHGTPELIKEDVRRVKAALGPRLIVSPSHEAVLPNVPPENIEALAEATLED